ncbi:hypothetical protein ADICYQ_3906 [Cyclobacterium qasimii M12-11B]|uniref:Uncharacterized protein n=1 Tax=Cyclobacterium qasimii M12-11B TaxID=641524 RepID=S7VAN4_9BACT|nr:hypothetical protein ADICYQ_3906 [Cyclobacterium qasimii M12-11B]
MNCSPAYPAFSKWKMDINSSRKSANTWPTDAKTHSLPKKS